MQDPIYYKNDVKLIRQLDHNRIAIFNDKLTFLGMGVKSRGVKNLVSAKSSSG